MSRRRIIGLVSFLGFAGCTWACGSDTASLEQPEPPEGGRETVKFSEESLVLESDQITVKLSASSSVPFEVEISPSSNVGLVAGATRAVDGELVRDLVVYRRQPSAEPSFELLGSMASGSVASMSGVAVPYAGARRTTEESGCGVWFPEMTVVFESIAPGEIAEHLPRVASDGSCEVGAHVTKGEGPFLGIGGWYYDPLLTNEEPPDAGPSILFVPSESRLYVGEIEFYGVNGHLVLGERVRIALIGRAL